MSEITTIGLDLAKHVFQVHGIDAQGPTVEHDAADAEAICETVQRPTMRFVPVKTASWPRAAGAPAHDAGERVAGTSGGVRNRGGAGLAQCQRADCHCSRRWRYAPA